MRGQRIAQRRRIGRWKARVLRRQRIRKKRYCRRRGCELRGARGSEFVVEVGAAFSMRAQVR